MRILVHDYAGHPFQIQLSRWLASRGHTVRHAYCGDIETPRGPLAPRPDDPASLSIRAWGLGRPLPKYHPFRRWRHERRYAALAARHLRAFAPDAVLSANAPPGVQAALLRAAHAGGARFVNWLQDIVSLVAARSLPRALPVVGHLAAAWLRRQEFSVLAAGDGVVAITPDFVPLCVAGGVAAGRIAVIPNWAPLALAPSAADVHAWRRRHGLGERLLLLYSGTLGLKHDPAMLAALAEAMPEADVVVASQGLGRDWLEAARRDRGLSNLHLLDFQDSTDLPAMLAAADILLVILEDYAGVLSVPSKVLTVLAAGRPMVAAIPSANLAARTILAAGAGTVVAPGDRPGFVDSVRRMADDAATREACGRAGRAFAEAAFDIDRIGGEFLAVLAGSGA